MGLLTKDAILSAKDSQTADVDCPEWGGTVRVRGLSAKERDDYEASMLDAKGKVSLKHARAKLVALAAIDDKGSPLFTAGDVLFLSNKSATPIDRIADEVRRLSGMRREDLEDAAKNSETIPEDGSPSA